jgi:hypothetical protein
VRKKIRQNKNKSCVETIGPSSVLVTQDSYKISDPLRSQKRHIPPARVESAAGPDLSVQPPGRP